MIAVDIGNARIKVGRFAPAWDQECSGLPNAPSHRRPGPGRKGSVGNDFPHGLPAPAATLSVDGTELRFDPLLDWLGKPPESGFSWWIGSVNRPATTALLDWLHKTRPQDPITLLSSADLPLTIRVPQPDRVGIDRLLDAVAANVLRSPEHPAVVVDVGTAITIDLVAADGAFCGGAIAPGIAMSARALNEFTDLLPWVDVAELHEPPPPVGASTTEAMRSGLFWFAVGTIREFVAQMAACNECSGRPVAPKEPNVFLTGGASAAVAGLLGYRTQLVPHLALAGIALTARGSRKGSL